MYREARYILLVKRGDDTVIGVSDTCKNLGADEPAYILYSEYIIVKFCAQQNAVVPDSKVPKHQSTAEIGALNDALEHLMNN